MYRRTLLAAISALLLAASQTTGAGPQDLPDVLTVKKVLINMQQHFSKMKTYQSGFKILLERNKYSESMSGTVKYRSPDSIIFLFESPKDQIIWSDGKVLKVFLPDLKVIGEQHLDTANPDLMFINNRTSFYQLTKQYNFFFPEKNMTTVNGQRIVILHLKQKNVYSGFKTIDLWVSRDNWMIMKASGRTRDDRTVTVNFYDISLNTPITDHELDFDLPVDIQTIKNPFYEPASGKK